MSDIALLHEWLDSRGIPRTDQEVPWEEPRTLSLSTRVLKLHRATLDRRAELSEAARQELEAQARRTAILETGYLVYVTDSAQAYRIVGLMGLEDGALDEYIAYLDAQDRDDREEAA
jgi:hypothetical protein